MISGGVKCENSTSCDGASESVTLTEIWSPTRGQCSIPNSNVSRIFHSLDGLIACGGYEFLNGSAVYDKASSTCETFVNGKWIISHTLLSPRFGHVSWNSDDGIYLIGGSTLEASSRQSQTLTNSTEKITIESNESELGFDLRYSIIGVFSCVINLGDTMIITGGFSESENRTKISRYNKDGWIEDLPDIDIREEYGILFWKGCSYYTNSESKRVTFPNIIVTSFKD